MLAHWGMQYLHIHSEVSLVPLLRLRAACDTHSRLSRLWLSAVRSMYTGSTNAPLEDWITQALVLLELC